MLSIARQRKHEGSSSSLSAIGRERIVSAKRSTCSCHAIGTLKVCKRSRAALASLFAPRVLDCFARAKRQYALETPKGAGSRSSWASSARDMLKTVSGVSAVNGSSVYL